MPLLFLLSMPWLDRRLVLILWPLTHLPDIDYILIPHRALAHNVWILLPFIGLGIWAWRKGKVELTQAMIIGSTYIASHITMDVFAGGVTLLYPVSYHTTCYYAEIKVVTATNTPFLDAGVCSFDGIPTVATVYTWLPYTEAALLAFLLPATVAVLAWRAWWRRRNPA